MCYLVGALAVVKLEKLNAVTIVAALVASLFAVEHGRAAINVVKLANSF